MLNTADHEAASGAFLSLRVVVLFCKNTGPICVVNIHYLLFISRLFVQGCLFAPNCHYCVSILHFTIFILHQCLANRRQPAKATFIHHSTHSTVCWKDCGQVSPHKLERVVFYWDSSILQWNVWQDFCSLHVCPKTFLQKDSIKTACDVLGW